jgi:hypothetical protein
MTTGLGVEMYCLDRMRTGKYVSGRAALAQAIYRRLTTPRGTLRGGDDEQAYGIDLPGFVGDTATQIAVAALPGIIRAELLEDDRIVDAVATVIADAPSNGLVTLTIEIRVVPVDDDAELTLTIAVTETSVELLSVSA